MWQNMTWTRDRHTGTESGVLCLTTAAQGASALDQLFADTQSPLILERRPGHIVTQKLAYLEVTQGMQVLTMYLERSRPG